MGKRGLSMSDAEILAALRLRDEGVSYAEIARRLGRTERAWQMRVSAVHRELEASEA